MRKTTSLAVIVLAAACGHSYNNKQPTVQETRPPVSDETRPVSAYDPESEIHPVSGQETPPAPAPQMAQAGAEVTTVKGKGTAKVTIEQTNDVTKLTVDFKGMKPGIYALELHEHGDCGGTNFVNTGEKWGGVSAELGTVLVTKDGTGSFTKEIGPVSVRGDKGLNGRSIVVFEVTNRAPPTPMGCGVINIIEGASNSP